jgi:hypothetical protein
MLLGVGHSMQMPGLFRKHRCCSSGRGHASEVIREYGLLSSSDNILKLGTFIM